MFAVVKVEFDCFAQIRRFVEFVVELVVVVILAVVTETRVPAVAVVETAAEFLFAFVSSVPAPTSVGGLTPSTNPTSGFVQNSKIYSYL